MSRKHDVSVLALFTTFFKIGAFTFGGGYAMIPLFHKEIVETHGWISDEEMLDIIAIAESTPGVIAVNMATFVGYKVAGVLGSTIATLAVVLPSFIVISIISQFFLAFKQITVVAWAFAGIRAAVLVLMTNAVLKLSKLCRLNVLTLSLAGGAFILSTFLGIHAIPLLLAAAILGILAGIWFPSLLQGGDKQ